MVLLKQHWLSWFNSRQPREQILLLTVVALVVIYLLYLVAWQPVTRAREQLVVSNRLAFDDLETVQALAAEYQLLKRAAPAQSVKTGQSLLQIIDTSVAQYQLSMTRLQPSASGDVQIRFENVLFNAIIAWLYHLESEYAIHVKDISITPSHADGLVSVSVRLYRDA